MSKIHTEHNVTKSVLYPYDKSIGLISSPIVESILQTTFIVFLSGRSNLNHVLGSTLTSKPSSKQELPFKSITYKIKLIFSMQ